MTAQGYIQPSITCQALEKYDTLLNTRNLTSCVIKDTDLPACRKLTCKNNDPTDQRIASLVINLVPCGIDGTRPGIQVTANSFSGRALVNETFFEATLTPLNGLEDTYFKISIIPGNYSIKFSVCALHNT